MISLFKSYYDIKVIENDYLKNEKIQRIQYISFLLFHLTGMAFCRSIRKSAGFRGSDCITPPPSDDMERENHFRL